MLVRYPRTRYSRHPNCLYARPDRERSAPAADVAAEPAASPQGVVIDRERRTASVDGRPISLTYLEFELLARLVTAPRRVHTRTQLINEVWRQPSVGDTRTVDVHVARLRRKLGPAHRSLIATVRQVGYTYRPA
ncbi:winged helix-turn-helix domain-containing protein [Streptantibioticus rubrisoli]|uniref:winged helix-turn-helix domain-containing protein n=1 Tax=Streptantibioticus rubrisoli TaxID=1387313 RepID=UPI003556A9D1